MKESEKNLLSAREELRNSPSIAPMELDNMREMMQAKDAEISNVRTKVYLEVIDFFVLIWTSGYI